MNKTKLKIAIASILCFAGSLSIQAQEIEIANPVASIKVSVSCDQMGRLVFRSVNSDQLLRKYSYWTGTVNYCNEQKKAIQQAIVGLNPPVVIAVWRYTAEYSLLSVDAVSGNFFNLEKGLCWSIEKCRVFQKDQLLSNNSN